MQCAEPASISRIPEERVSLWHWVGRNRMDKPSDQIIEALKEHGLLTAKELFDKGLTDRNPASIKGMHANHHKNVYFRDSSPFINKYSTCPEDIIVEYKANPEDISVYNQELRVGRPDLVPCSRLSYYDYKKKHENFESMPRNKDGDVLMKHHLTANPEYRKRVLMNTFKYSFNLDNIPESYYPEYVIEGSIHPSKIAIYKGTSKEPVYKGEDFGK